MPAAAPNSLDLVIDFVNTLDREQEEDSIASPAALGEWLGAAGLLPEGVTPAASPEDLDSAVRLREALRELMLANNRQASGRAAGEELERVARGGELAVRFAADGSTSLAPGVGGVSGALARLLVPVALARGDGSWERVKACRAADCGWAFFDRSRNRSGVWCDMAVCGNRTKVRAYRERGTGRR